MDASRCESVASSSLDYDMANNIFAWDWIARSDNDLFTAQLSGQ